MALRTNSKPARNRRTTRNRQSAPVAPKAPSRDRSKFRLYSVAFLFALLWMGLWGRAFYLQIVQGPELAAMARSRYTGSELTSGARGSILDRHGNILAKSVDTPSVWVNPRAVINQAETARVLAEALHMPVSTVRSMLKEEKSFVWVRRKASFAAAETIREAGLKGVYFESEYERLYPYKHLAGQLLGFVDIDDRGREGVEGALEETLSGRRVRQPISRDASGKRLVVRGAEDNEDLRGADVRLTIDSQIQFFAEEALAAGVERYAAAWGGCIVVDTANGDILAWAQYPFFDPNKAGSYPAAVRRNRVAGDALEQGSTIKSFLVAAALEEKVVTPQTTIDCERGSWKIGKVTIHDTHTYSTLPVEKVLHYSSNIGAAKIGLKLGTDRYRDYLIQLGFGKRTGLPVTGESTGIFRSARYWSEVDLASASFGQSFSATLAQMAQAYLFLAGDGTYRPLRLVLAGTGDADAAPKGAASFSDTADGSVRSPTAMPRTGESETQRLFSAETLRQVRGMLREVVEEDGGTGKQARIAGMTVGGKTGTAQKADKSGKYGDGRVGSFVGMLPVDDPRYLVCVLLDEPKNSPYGGVIAAPIFRDVAVQTMAYNGFVPDEEALSAGNANKKNSGKIVKKIVAGKEVAKEVASEGHLDEALDALRREVEGVPVSGRRPSADQRPAADRRSDTGGAPAATSGLSARQSLSVVMAETKDITAASPARPSTVPSLLGLGVRGAVAVLSEHGVKPELKGNGRFVVRQTPEAGAAWPSEGRSCVLWLEEQAL